MRRCCLLILPLLLAGRLLAQPRSGTIKVRKSKNIKGLYILEEGQYYQMKLYVRLFDNNAAVFLYAPVDARTASDSAARLLYTYREKPAVYRVVNDSVFIEGHENQAPFLYRGVVKDNRLKLRKYHKSSEKNLVFKKLL